MKNEKKKKGSVILKILLAVAAVIAVLLIVNRYTVRQVWCNIFSPTLELDESTEWAGGKSFIHLPYAEDSEAQYIDLYVPESKEPVPLFVLIHGGGFAFNDAQSRQAQFMYRYFRDHGFACASVNYRLSTEAAYPAAVCDVKAAVRYLCSVSDEYGIDADRIAVWGESAGGYLSSMCALSAPDAYSDTLCIGETEEKHLNKKKIMTTKNFNAKKMLMSTLAAVAFTFVFTTSANAQQNYPIFVLEDDIEATENDEEQDQQDYDDNESIIDDVLEHIFGVRV